MWKKILLSSCLTLATQARASDQKENLLSYQCQWTYGRGTADEAVNPPQYLLHSFGWDGIKPFHSPSKIIDGERYSVGAGVSDDFVQLGLYNDRPGGSLAVSDARKGADHYLLAWREVRADGLLFYLVCHRR